MTEAQCARCGSSVGWVDCWSCDDGYIEADFGDGIVPDMEFLLCQHCGGAGGRHTCISDYDWCQAHPLAGRENVLSGTVETFVVSERSQSEEA